MHIKTCVFNDHYKVCFGGCGLCESVLLFFDVDGGSNTRTRSRRGAGSIHHTEQVFHVGATLFAEEAHDVRTVVVDIARLALLSGNV